MAIFIMLAGLIALYAVQERFFRRKWDDKLFVDVCFEDKTVNTGDSSFLTETIVNKKKLPLTVLQLEFFVHRNLKFSEKGNIFSADNNYRTDVFSVMPWEKINRKIPFQCSGRGYYRIDRIQVSSYDLFFSKKFLKNIPLSANIYVYPKKVNASLFDVAFQQILGSILTKKYSYEDPFEFRGIRQYQEGDSLKDINWKASAKTGSHMVNMHHFTSGRKVTILLNIDPDPRWRDESLLEAAISLAASYSERLILSGIPTKLVTNGIDVERGENAFVPFGTGKAQMKKFMEVLSRINTEKQTKNMLSFVEKEECMLKSSSSFYILISENRNTKLLTAYNRICKKSPGSQWLAPVHKDTAFSAHLCPFAQSFPWEVEKLG